MGESINLSRAVHNNTHSRNAPAHSNMSDLNSWEDDPAAQEDLSSQTQQMNLNNTPQQPQPGGGAASFRPGANSFQPGAQSFQPGQNFQQYGGYDQSGYQNQNYYQGGQGAQGYGGYPQYGQQGGYNNQVTLSSPKQLPPPHNNPSDRHLRLRSDQQM